MTTPWCGASLVAGAPYGSDLRLLRGLGNIPTVHYGPGDAALAHGPRESAPVDELLTAAQVLALTALDHCTPGNRSPGSEPAV